MTGTLLPTGSVTFREGTTATSPQVAPPVTLTTVNGVQTAKLELTGLSVGTHTYIATYSGSTAFNASTSLTTTIVVTAVAKIATTTTGSTSTPQVGPGADVKLKAVVKQVSGSTKPTGSVTFSEGGTALAPAAPLVLIGTVMTAKLPITTLAVGNHQIIATYGGSSVFNGSASSAIAVSVGKVNSTCTLTVKPSTNDPAKTAMSVVVKSAVIGAGTPTGGGFFYVDAQAQQPYVLSDTGRGQIPAYAFPVPTASHTVRVTYDGDAAFNACSATQTFTAP